MEKRFLSPTIIERLIEVGHLETADSLGDLSDLPRLAELAWINTLHWTEWERAVKDCSLGDLGALVRAVVRLEKKYKWRGGSVAATLWLFRIYRDRDPSRAVWLARWILRNKGKNQELRFHYKEGIPYWRFEPLTPPLSVEQLQEEQESERRRCEAHRANRLRQRAGAHATRLEKSQKQAMLRTEAINSMTSLPALERLESLAREWPFPLDAFPTSAVPVVNKVLVLLDPELRKTLIKKIGGRRGFWGRFRRELEKYA